jgi:hypothetical protein
MDPSNLQFWGVIGTWVASIGTVGAVITSLWFAIHQNTIKLKVSAGLRNLATQGQSDQPEYCCIQVVNVGLRSAKITNVSWRVRRWRTKRQIIQMFGFQQFDDIPKTLAEGEEATFMIPVVSSGDDSNWKVYFAKKVVGDDDPRLLKSLTVDIHTSVGQSFF